jgi:DNA-binding beta-propeller fold protein YncE
MCVATIIRKVFIVALGSLLCFANHICAATYTSFTIGGLAGVRGAADETNGGALFNQPWGVATDKRGNVYVAEWGNSTIRKLTLIKTNWVVATIIGAAGNDGHNDGTNTGTRLNHPHGIVVDRAGNLYIADTFNNTVRKATLVGGKLCCDYHRRTSGHIWQC